MPFPSATEIFIQASKEEINNSFRKLSRIYHPDKHLDSEMKEKAENMFTKIKKAHEGQ